MGRKVFSLALALTLILSLAATASAASDEARRDAQSLYDMGLFQGVGAADDGSPNFDLDRAPTRHEAVTMLVRLLGKEAEATDEVRATPFTDVADWAAPYVGYAYANGLTNGTSATTFGGDALVDADQYLTFLLRALGYTSGLDFQWETAGEFAEEALGLSHDLVDDPFTRGDVAVVSYLALDAFTAEGAQKLGEALFGDFSPARVTVPTADPYLKLYYTEKAPDLEVVARYDEGGEHAVWLTLAPLAPVTDLRVLRLSDPTGDGGWTVEEVCREIGDVAPGQGVEIGFTVPEFWSDIGVAYTDQTGEAHVFLLAESGYDGAHRAREVTLEGTPGAEKTEVQCPRCGFVFSAAEAENVSCLQCGGAFARCADCGEFCPAEEMVGSRCVTCWASAQPSPLFSDPDRAVTTAFQYANDEVSWRVPHVNSQMRHGAYLNGLIDGAINPLISGDLTNMREGVSATYYAIDYTVIWHDTFFTLILSAEAPGDNVHYWVYNVDLVEGCRVSNEALLKRAGLTEEEFVRRAKESAWARFEAMVEGTSTDVVSAEEMAYHRENMAAYVETYIHPDMPLFFDEEGRLTVITPIASFAGSDSYERFVVVE